MRLSDSDVKEPHELIDRFAINVTSLEPVRDSYFGIFGLAVMEITTEISCEQDSCEFLLVRKSFPLEAAVISPLASALLLTLIISILGVYMFKRKRRKASSDVVQYVQESGEGHIAVNSRNDVDPNVSQCAAIARCQS